MIGSDRYGERAEKPSTMRRRALLDTLLDNRTPREHLLVRDAVMAILKNHHQWPQGRIALAFGVSQPTVSRGIRAVEEMLERAEICA